MDQYLALGLLALAVLLGLASFALHRFLGQRILGNAGYEKKKFLTSNEVDFYRRLSRCLDTRWTVLAQVSMGALMDTRLLPAHPRYWRARQEFANKICDFVVCDARTLEPQLIIELDDRMHDFERDRGRDTITSRAGYRTLRFWSRKKPSDLELKAQLSKALGLN